MTRAPILAASFLCLSSLSACNDSGGSTDPAATGTSGNTAGAAGVSPSSTPRSGAGASPAAAGGGAIARAAAGGGGREPSAGTAANVGAGGAASAGRNASAGGAGSAGDPGGASGAGNEAGRSGNAGAGGGGTSGGAAGSSAAEPRCPPGPYPAPVPAGASPARIEGVPPLDAFNDNGRTRTNVEGPVWIGDTLYVSEFPFTPAPVSRVLAIVPAASGTSATVAVALASCGANGLAVDAAGNLIATDHQRGAIARYPFPLGSSTPIIASFEGQRFNSPNDVAVRSDGTLYFSDPSWQAPNMHPQPQTRVYRVAPGSAEALVIDATRSQPNGVTLSPDERTLYVAGSDGIFTYPVGEDGEVTPMSGVRISGFSGSADGLTVDCAGNLYAASGTRVVVLSPAGNEIASIAVMSAESVTNVAFGGPDHKTLFITAMGGNDQRGVFRVELAVPGLPY